MDAVGVAPNSMETFGACPEEGRATQSVDGAMERRGGTKRGAPVHWRISEVLKRLL